MYCRWQRQRSQRPPGGEDGGSCLWTGRWKCPSFGPVWLFLTSWTVLCQAPLSLKPSKARTLEWGATPFSRGSSQPRDRTPSLPYCGQILLHLSHQRSPTADMRPLLWTLSSSPRRTGLLSLDENWSQRLSRHHVLSILSGSWLWVMFSRAWFLPAHKKAQNTREGVPSVSWLHGDSSPQQTVLGTESLGTGCPPGVSLASAHALLNASFQTTCLKQTSTI